jgi:hypothetical protein
MGKSWMRWATGLLLLGLLMPACARKTPGQLLVVYSGDWQGYLDPCG